MTEGAATRNARELAVGLMENRFRAAADALSTYVAEGRPTTSGAAQFAILHLVSRSVADLRCGQYLASSGYPIQAYSVIRPVSESLNLIDLFVDQPDLAEEWAAGKWWLFKPAHVREQIGVENDDFYSFLAEHSHPRFAGLQLSAFLRAGEPDEHGRQRAISYMGEIPFDIPAVVVATVMPSFLLAQLVVASAQLKLAFATQLEWPRLIRTVAAQLGEGWKAVRDELPPGSGEDGEVVRPLAYLDGVLASLEKLATEADTAIADATRLLEASHEPGDRDAP